MIEVLSVILAAEPQACVDARDPERLHRVLRRLDEAGPLEGIPPLSWTPDPGVGRRYAGVTVALWDVVGSGAVAVDEQQGHAWLSSSVEGSTRGLRLPPGTRAAVQRSVGILRADSATSSRKRRTAASSPAATCRPSEARPVHPADDTFLHRADRKTVSA